MATMTLSNPTDTANRLVTALNKSLTESLKYNLVLGSLKDVMQEVTIPRNVGSKTIRTFKPRKASIADIENATEGVPSNTTTEVTTGYVDITLQQLIEKAKVSDLLTDIDVFNWVNTTIGVMKEDCALKYDTVIRNQLITDFTNAAGSFEQFANTTSTGVGATDFATLVAKSQANAKLTRLEILKAGTTMKANFVPLINGGFVAVIGAQGIHDLRQDTTLVNAWLYQSADKLYKQELINLDGVRCMETNSPFVEDDVYQTYNATDSGNVGLVYSAFVFGRNAFAAPTLKGADNPALPKVTVLRNPDKSDIVGQFTAMGWKSYYGAKLMKTNLAGDVPHAVLLRHKSTYA